METYAELATRLNPDMPMLIEHLPSEEAFANSMAYVRERLKAYC